MPSNRGKVWMTFSSGPASSSIAISSVARFFVPTIVEAEQAKEYSRYTVLRLIYNLECRGNTNEAIVTAGLIYLPEGSAVATHGPVAQPSGSWLYHEEFQFESQSVNFDRRVSRDIGTKRISRGLHNELLFYISNRSTITAVNVHLSGRVLILEA